MNEIVIGLLYIITILITLSLASSEADKMLKDINLKQIITVPLLYREKMSTGRDTSACLFYKISIM